MISVAEFVSRESLKDAFKKFRVRGDKRWLSDERAEEVIVPLVEDYLGNIGSLDESDMSDILDTIRG